MPEGLIRGTKDREKKHKRQNSLIIPTKKHTYFSKTKNKPISHHYMVSERSMSIDDVTSPTKQSG